MTEPRTEAGRAHITEWFAFDEDEQDAATRSILAIEAEAVAAERARIAAGVRALPVGFLVIDGIRRSQVNRYDALAIIEGES